MELQSQLTFLYQLARESADQEAKKVKKELDELMEEIKTECLKHDLESIEKQINNAPNTSKYPDTLNTFSK